MAQAILVLNPPNNVKELRQFLGMVQYYRDMWAKHSEMLAPLTDLVGECRETKATKRNGTKKKPWRWDSILFINKHLTTSSLPSPKRWCWPTQKLSKPFEIYIDASTMQLGAVITQGNRPIAFFSRKLSKAQTKYSIPNIELLAIVET
jgi:hypothetical protein